MSMTDIELTSLIYEALEKAKDGGAEGSQIGHVLSKLQEQYDLFDILYEPTDDLKEKLKEYQDWLNQLLQAKGKSKEALQKKAGNLMEELAYLTFSSLRGYASIKSYQSYSSQHDLVISGTSNNWNQLLKRLNLMSGNTIIIEAKNIEQPISDQQFSRLCGILQNKYQDIGSLGVFFSRSDATGFPQQNKGRQRSLRDARATQILFHAKTKKFVIVLNHKDILSLDRLGSLPRLLEAKIRDVEEASGLSIDFDEDWNEVDLPEHLAKHLS